MPNNGINADKSPPKLDKIDTAICNILQIYPDITTHGISKHLNNTGTIISHQAIYSRLKKRDYLRGKVEEIQAHHRQQMVREDYPLARSVLNKALKNKDLDIRDKTPLVKLVYDKVHGDQGPASPATTINIGHMQVLQGIMRGNTQDTGGGTNE